MLVRWRRRERPNSNGSHCQFTSLYIVITYKFKWQVARGMDRRYAVLHPESLDIKSCIMKSYVQSPDSRSLNPDMF